MFITVATMSSRSRLRVIFLSSVPSRSSTWPTKSHGPAAQKTQERRCRRACRERTRRRQFAPQRIENRDVSSLKASDDVIAIGPGVRPYLVLVVAVGVAVVDDIEPMAGPALAVARRGQQPIDQPLVCVRRVIADEGVDLRRESAAGRAGRKYSRRMSVRRSASGFGFMPCC